MKREQVELFRLTLKNMTKSIDLDEISEKTTLILKEFKVFYNSSRNFPFIFHSFEIKIRL